MTRFAKLIDNMVDTVSIPEPEDVENWVSVDDNVFPGFIQNEDGTFSAPLPEAPIPDQVDVERIRRVIAGTVITIDGVGDIPVTGKDSDQLALLALKDSARDLKAAGITDAVLPYRDADNVTHMLTADQMITLVDTGKSWVQTIFTKSWAIKAMDPIPSDYATNESYWSVP